MQNSLNETVEAVLGWIGDRKDTAVLITADHETGGLSVSASEEYLLPNTYKTANNNQITYIFESGSHTEADVLLYTHGFKLDASTLPHFKSSNIIKNSDVPVIMRRLLNPGN